MSARNPTRTKGPAGCGARFNGNGKLGTKRTFDAASTVVIPNTAIQSVGSCALWAVAVHTHSRVGSTLNEGQPPPSTTRVGGPSYSALCDRWTATGSSVRARTRHTQRTGPCICDAGLFTQSFCAHGGFRCTRSRCIDSFIFCVIVWLPAPYQMAATRGE